ncbi:SDR family oxidoreductase [Yinghuangia soli]|uniref:SDR family oxidoreductase n=1 Tax=Yinghuangia soli TaxID=2908204 RepID=A0AA41Q878_9ACTN|nr:SDR family oxidoreductase [Yinghuangia soli]MCF2533258.1 SDR family oxidoreductase [Yinghuangia soli]
MSDIGVRIDGVTALVTGANRGLGRAIASALLDRGAATVYAGVRDAASVTDSRLMPVELDVTDPAAVAAAALRCGDTALLVNNAGIARGGGFAASASSAAARAEMETNYFGTLEMSRAFAPVLARNGGGALVNVLSVLSWITLPNVASYAASKAAAWSLTNALRLELAEQRTLVVGVHAAFIDTDMAAGIAQPKTSPEDVAAQILDAVEKGLPSVFADAITRGTAATGVGRLGVPAS